MTSFPCGWRRLSLVLMAGAALLLGGCGAMWAQNPSSPLKPVNAVVDGTAGHRMLKGHDGVSYFTRGTHEQGTSLHQSLYQSVNFRFARTEHKALSVLPGHIKLADRCWADEVAGSNSVVQHSKRLVLRVPHDKSGEETARAVAQVSARGS